MSIFAQNQGRRRKKKIGMETWRARSHSLKGDLGEGAPQRSSGALRHGEKPFPTPTPKLKPLRGQQTLRILLRLHIFPICMTEPL